MVILYDRLFTNISNFTDCQKQPMVFFPSRRLMMSGSVSNTTHSQHLSQKLHSKSFCCSLTRAFKESVWETETNFLPTLTTRHKSEECETSGQQTDCCSQVFKNTIGSVSSMLIGKWRSATVRFLPPRYQKKAVYQQ